MSRLKCCIVFNRKFMSGRFDLSRVSETVKTRKGSQLMIELDTLL